VGGTSSPASTFPTERLADLFVAMARWLEPGKQGAFTIGFDHTEIEGQARSTNIGMGQIEFHVRACCDARNVAHTQRTHLTQSFKKEFGDDQIQELDGLAPDGSVRYAIFKEALRK